MSTIMLSKKINVSCPLNDLGYGIASKNIVRSLDKSADVSVFPIGPTGLSSQSEVSLFSGLVEKQFSFDADSPCLKIWHENQMAERIGRGRFFGFPFFEIDRFDKARKSHLGSCDEIFVASDWAKEIVEREVPGIPTHVAPLGVDTSLFKTKNTHTDKCIFFNCGKWEVRKGHDLLLHLFKAAFPQEDDVELWMMCSNPFLGAEQAAGWENFYKQDPRCKVLKRVQTQEELAEIMSKTTCGVFPSRAEGWNLEILEMMSLGKNIIATDYSAHQQFCNKENSFLAKPLKKEPASDGIWFNGEAEWASLDGIEEELIEHMQEVYSRWKDSKGSLVNEEGLKTAAEFSWDNTADIILDTMGLKNEN